MPVTRVATRQIYPRFAPRSVLIYFQLCWMAYSGVRPSPGPVPRHSNVEQAGEHQHAFTTRPFIRVHCSFVAAFDFPRLREGFGGGLLALHSLKYHAL